MNIDPKGTAPGLAAGAAVKPNVVNMRCKNSKCDSIRAEEIKIESAEHVGQRVYRCVKCGHILSLSVGGTFTL